MLLPEHLVRYIILHEYAHLTHMDHSPAFHALVNQYTGGKEKELEKELKQFVWPIIK
jgi:predicted metal-dependent hydrolase